MAEGARLESVYAGDRIVGSNPTPSANVTELFHIEHYSQVAVQFEVELAALLGRVGDDPVDETP